MTAWPDVAWCIYGVSQNAIYYIDNQENLWLSTAPWTTEAQELVDRGVASFRPVTGSELSTLYVQSSDLTLWYETGPWVNGHVKQQVDTNVWYYDGNVTLDVVRAYIGDSSGNLWLAQGPWGNEPLARQQVDGNVSTFQCINDNTVIVLGKNNNLWLEKGPWGTVPPARQQIDGNVADFQALSDQLIYVLGTDRNLWLEQAQPPAPGAPQTAWNWGRVPPYRAKVDSNVGSFQALSPRQVFVLDRQGNLWLETASPTGTWPLNRTLIETNVLTFHALSNLSVYVVHANDMTLWLETGPWSSPPQPNRQLVAAELGPPPSKTGSYAAGNSNNPVSGLPGGGDIDS